MKKVILIILILIISLTSMHFIRASIAQTSNEHIMRAKRFMTSREYDKAIEEYTQALGSDPNNVTIYISRAAAYDMNKQFREAFDDYNSVILREPALLQGFQEQYDRLKKMFPENSKTQQ
jgi:DnaJ family protein C protein 3